MKFGGTSVGSVDSILKVKQIVEAEKEPVIVVVSALGDMRKILLSLLYRDKELMFLNCGVGEDS